MIGRELGDPGVVEHGASIRPVGAAACAIRRQIGVLGHVALDQHGLPPPSAWIRRAVSSASWALLAKLTTTQTSAVAAVSTAMARPRPVEAPVTHHR